MLIGAIAGCRTADSPSPPTAPGAGVELEQARGSCERGEPGGCDRVELEQSRIACKAGELHGCDHYDLVRSICFEHPEGPLCDALRRHGDLPPEPPPLAEAFGCRVTEGPIGPHAVVCLAEDRVSIYDVTGQWEQWKIGSWGREDTQDRAIRVAWLVDGPPLWLTTVEVEGTGPLCGVVVVRSTKRRAARAEPPPGVCKSTALHVVGSQGLLHATLGARDLEAEAALAEQPTVEEVCRHADACELAIAAARPRPAPPPAAEDDVEISYEVDAPPVPSPGPRTLQHCHARWWSAALAEQERGRKPPAECGDVLGQLGEVLVEDPHFGPWPDVW